MYIIQLSFQLNIPAIGFSPQLNTISRIHGHNEYLNAAAYLDGIDIYKHVIMNIASK